VKTKYVDEHFPIWFIFGESRDGRDNVDVSDGYGDILEQVDRAVAEKLIQARYRFNHELIEIFSEHPEALNCVLRRNVV
jgi:hypothetical protein